MPHDMPLISTIVGGLVLAFLFGTVANRLKLPPLIGYLLAGVLVGPHTPGFVADSALAQQLSEIGVILLMFGVGLHFSLKDLLSVRAIAIPGALVQIAGATAMGVGLALLLGWSLGAGLIFGLALSVASTVVLLKALQDRHLVESERGRIAVGWLIVEDIAMILALVLIPALAPVLGGVATEMHDPFVALFERLTGIALNLWGILAITLVKLAAFVGFMLVVGRRLIPWGLHATAHMGSRELFRLAVLAIALGVAAGSSYLFGVSLALGAFFAGMILSESELSHRAAQETLPLRDAFAVLFFVAVGMLFDPAIVVEQPLPVLGTVFVILIGKSVLAYLIGLAFRQSAATALTISASLAQIGEFSFILATLGVGLGLLPVEGRDLILAGALISILVNPLLFHLAESLRPRVEARSAARHPAIVVPERVEPELDGRAAPPPAEGAPAHPLPTSLSRHAVLVGYGRVGRVVADGLARHGKPFVLIEDSETAIAAARAAGVEVVAGNAATAEALALANIEAAETLIVAIPHVFEAGQAVEQGRRLNPGLEIVARAHTDEEIAYLNACGANQVIVGAREIGLGMLGWTTGDAAHQQAAERTQAGFEAIAAALAVDSLPAARRAPDVAPEPPLLPAAVDAFEAAIEAAHPAHVPAGPAEPPELVPALGEMPAEDEAEAESADVPLGYVSVAQLPPQAPVVEAPVHFEPPAEVSDDLASAAVEGVPAPPPSPPPPRAEGPANTPGAPFRPKPRDADGA